MVTGSRLHAGGRGRSGAGALDGLVRLALENNPGLKAAKAEVESAREDARQARLSFLPSFDASGRSGARASCRKSTRRFFFPPASSLASVPAGISLGLRTPMTYG